MNRLKKVHLIGTLFISMIILSGCPDPEPCNIQCVNGTVTIDCSCDCHQGWTGPDCGQLIPTSYLEADLVGPDSNTIRFISTHLDFHFGGDSLVLDGYIDEHNYIYIHYKQTPPITKGTYTVTQPQSYVSHEHNTHFGVFEISQPGVLKIDSIKSDGSYVKGTFDFKMTEASSSDQRRLANGIFEYIP